MNDEPTNEDEPSAESLAEMPEIDEKRFRRIPGRGHYAHLRVPTNVMIDSDIVRHFGSDEAINAALRTLMTEQKK